MNKYIKSIFITALTVLAFAPAVNAAPITSGSGLTILPDDYGNSFEDAQVIYLSPNTDIRYEYNIDYEKDEDYFAVIPQISGKFYFVMGRGQVTIFDENHSPMSGPVESLEAGHTYYLVFGTKGTSIQPYVGEGNFYVGVYETLYGNVNQDKMVDNGDFMEMKRFLLGEPVDPIMFDSAAADLNGDDVVDSADYALLRKYLLDIIKVFPRDTNSDGYMND
jgi:hypothetical protein